jgi:hypothetical protein
LVLLPKGISLHIHSPQYEIDIFNEQTYTISSIDNVRIYDKEYDLYGQFEPSSRHGIFVTTPSGSKYSSIILAGGGGSTVHQQSALILEDFLYIAVGDQICCMSLPQLQLAWHKKVDDATCFGIYYSQDNHCLISHGQLEIALITLKGDIEWRVSGKDIFFDGFSLFSDHIEVIDFNHERYRIDIINGQIRLI